MEAGITSALDMSVLLKSMQYGRQLPISLIQKRHNHCHKTHITLMIDCLLNPRFP